MKRNQTEKLECAEKYTQEYTEQFKEQEKTKTTCDNHEHKHAKKEETQHNIRKRK